MPDVEKMIYMNSLFEAYSSLLSETQKDILSDYYEVNLSISEIAENRNISRSAVEDALKKGTNKLIEFENKLGIVGKKNQISDILEKVKNEIKDESLLQEIEKIEKEL